MRWVRPCLFLALALSAPLLGSGCGYTFFPTLLIPVPMPAWVTERMEEKYCYKNDFRTPILPPINPGGPPPFCEDQPSVQRVIRAMPHVARGVPYLYEEFRDDVQVVNEKIKDTIDPPRYFPLVGPAQLHHCHWRCIIYYTETIQSDYPFPFRCKRPRTQVIYIDTDHLHLYPGSGNPEAFQSVTRDLSGP